MKRLILIILLPSVLGFLAARFVDELAPRRRDLVCSLVFLGVYALATWILWRLLADPVVDLNRCHKCGYDLRASPLRCPECGTPRERVDRS